MQEKVLIVDDEPDVIGALKAALRKEAFTIVGATSAEAAKTTLQEGSIGVVVIDERMPGKSGLELLQELAREYPDIPRIMLTGHANLDLALRSINDAAVFKFLQKPCDFQELAATIRAAFERRAEERAKNELVDLSKRQASLVAELESKRGDNGTPPAPPAPGDQPTDPVSYLAREEADLLSKREKEILRHLVTGKKPQEIAAALYISVHTARNHIKAIYQKLAVHSQGELIAKVLRAPGRDETGGPNQRRAI